MKKLIVFIGLFVAGSSLGQQYKSFPMWDYTLPVEQRVNDLVHRLTLEEKVGQMVNAAPAITHLGIPAYDWWNETLHGVARTPYHVTSYPQAIAMAATWDTAALFLMADYSATEGRAIYNRATAEGKNNERYMGLTYWTPNINIFRDPRWGRGQETYGEDPYLTAKLGAAFVRGLQGDDPIYLKAAACAKHFAVHSGPEPSRHSDDIHPSLHDLWDTYLPAFHELVVNAGVAGVMCAYNAVDGQPCCGNDLLMTNILRRQWKFTGYVTSDCWALDDFFKYHKTHKDATAAAADALIHSTDIECGTSVYYSLINAVKTGLISEAQLDTSLSRLFTIRYRLGLFDPVSQVRYAQTPDSVLESPEHDAHALKMARESIVLLKNSEGILPLSKKIKKIAVIGPNADNKIAVLGNYNGTPSRVVTVVEGIREKLGPDVTLIYEKAINHTNDTLLNYRDITAMLSFKGSPGVQAAYFDNERLEGTPLQTLIEKDIDHYWAEGQTPAPNLKTIHYSARYTTFLKAAATEIMNFEIDGDDGYRLFINDSLIVDAWTKNRWGARPFVLSARKDSSYKIVVEFHQNEGNAFIRVKAGDRVKTDFAALAGRLKDIDAIIFAGGISPQLEGEEMPVSVPGFDGGDRTSIMLPKVQTALLKALQQTGKPVVFVMMTGSAIAIPEEEVKLPAIINAWYGGQRAGTAIADVLFGDYNPSGRLPVTFYASDKDLRSFTDYSMQNRTYRYFRGKPLYPFGYGLSYTHFSYSELKVAESVRKGTPVSISVLLTNTGQFDGDEVVQLYVSHPGVANAPVRALKGFQRISLKHGESKKVSFTLTTEDLSLVDDNGIRYQPGGKTVISIGGGQPGQAHGGMNKVLLHTVMVR
ncbi:glycoside hydrolase family 3 C-terminal domain-containing protein [Chitinophaga sp. LS1]|uniref:glycoside hydrolase family 3 C-terminal domain-containing protein n=1 Tax=Chitinophaga sp. LS1 TaxID=3051176 RepID=UPI002AAB2F67|nr:glycoside hydrolase family 3 C-terminal domain-containing protein [Chitinophaga sp. LS1]WPV70545.1 glycoside hydrolase family 3 C-terminal domain-containing protein [Chitinophaga sp. LS1]